MIRPPATHLYRADLMKAVLAMCAGLSVGLSAAPAWADRHDEHDQDRARQAVQSGQALPLQTVLARLAPRYPGQVLEVELEDEHGRLVYEVKLLQPDGRLLKLVVDARTADVLKARPRSAAPDDGRRERR